MPTVATNAARAPYASMRTPAIAVPAAAPPKIMLALQAKASVTVPAGADPPSSTELQVLKGAIVDPLTASSTASNTTPGASTGRHAPIATAATSTGS